MKHADLPKRIQLRRTKGWRKPEGAIVVARPTKWGNPFRMDDWQGAFQALQLGCRGDARGRREAAVRMYRLWLFEEPKRVRRKLNAFEKELVVKPVFRPERPTIEQIQAALRGKDLACWCPLDQPCHADVLLELANRDPE